MQSLVLWELLYSLSHIYVAVRTSATTQERTNSLHGRNFALQLLPRLVQERNNRKPDDPSLTIRGEFDEEAYVEAPILAGTKLVTFSDQVVACGKSVHVLR